MTGDNLPVSDGDQGQKDATGQRQKDATGQTVDPASAGGRDTRFRDTDNQGLGEAGYGADVDTRPAGQPKDSGDAQEGRKSGGTGGGDEKGE